MQAMKAATVMSMMLADRFSLLMSILRRALTAAWIRSFGAQQTLQRGFSPKDDCWAPSITVYTYNTRLAV